MMADVQITSPRFIDEKVCLGKATLTFVGGVCMHVEGEIGEREAAKLYAQPDVFVLGPPKPVTLDLPGIGAAGPAAEPAAEVEPGPVEAVLSPAPADDATLEEAPAPTAPAPAAAPNDDLHLLTAKELRAKLDEFGVKYDLRAAKPALVALVRQATNDAAAKIEGGTSAPRARPDPELLRPDAGEDQFRQKGPLAPR